MTKTVALPEAVWEEILIFLGSVNLDLLVWDKESAMERLRDYQVAIARQVAKKLDNNVEKE